MNILHLTSWLSNAGGGIPPVIEALAGEMRKGSDTCSVWGLEDGSGETDENYEHGKGFRAAILGPRAIGYSTELRKKLTTSVTVDSVVHVHGLWMYPGLLGRNLAYRNGGRLLISPHGMLDPWALRNSRTKKRLAGWLYENRNLRKAHCLHALCASEASAIRAYGLKNPICVIPNGVDLVNAETLNRAERDRLERSDSPAGGGPAGPIKSETLKSERKILLFLGRLHPKKGLMNALRAWKDVQHSTSNIQHSTFHEWQFVIAGWDQGGHEAELKRLCREIGVSEDSVSVDQFLSETPTSNLRPPASVIFVGPAFGEQKDQLLRRASAFILPSFSEGLPMSVLEAWSYGLPVLMTDHCNLPEGFAASAALRIGTDVESIAEGMRLLQQSSIQDLQSLGWNGRALVERQFTWPQVAIQLKSVYEWVQGGGPRPECVEM